MELMLLVPLLEGVGWVIGKLWELYARVLNLPILVGAVLDGAAGVFFGIGMLDSESALTAVCGFLLSLGSAFFAAGSVVTWIAKVRDEKDEIEYRLRPPEPKGIAGRVPRGGLDSPHRTTA